MPFLALSSRKYTFNQLTNKKVKATEFEGLQEWIQHAKARLREPRNCLWLHEKVRARFLTSDPVVAFKCIRLIHLLSLETEVKKDTFACLRPLLMEMILKWEHPSFDISCQTCAELETKEDQAHLCECIVDYARYVDLRIDTIVSLEKSSLLTGLWNVQIQQGSNGVPVDDTDAKALTALAQRLSANLSSLTLCLNHLCDRRTSIFFPIYVEAVYNFILEGPLLFKSLISFISLYRSALSHIRLASSPIQASIQSFKKCFINLLSQSWRLTSHYTGCRAIIRDAAGSFAASCQSAEGLVLTEDVLEDYSPNTTEQKSKPTIKLKKKVRFSDVTREDDANVQPTSINGSFEEQRLVHPKKLSSHNESHTRFKTSLNCIENQSIDSPQLVAEQPPSVGEPQPTHITDLRDVVASRLRLSTSKKSPTPCMVYNLHAQVIAGSSG